MVPMLAIVGALVGAVAAARGIVLLVRGVRHADQDGASLDIIRGIRGIAVGVGANALASGVLLEQRWLVAFGLVFLLEELYETGVVAGVLRARRARRDAADVDRHAEAAHSRAIRGTDLKERGIETAVMPER